MPTLATNDGRVMNVGGSARLATQSGGTPCDCGCGGSPCGCPGPEGVVVDDCGAMTAATKLSWTIDASEVYLRAFDSEGGPPDASTTFDHTFEAQWDDGAGTIEPGPLVGCTTKLIGVRVDDAFTFGNPAVFDTLTDSGLPFFTFDESTYWNTSIETGGKHPETLQWRRTELSWSRDGNAEVRASGGHAEFGYLYSLYPHDSGRWIYPITVPTGFTFISPQPPEPFDPDPTAVGSHTSGQRAFPGPGILPWASPAVPRPDVYRLAAVARAATFDEGIVACALPSGTHDASSHLLEDDIYDYHVTQIFPTGPNATYRERVEQVYHYDNTYLGREPRPLTFASAVVDEMDDLPTNPGCKNGPRAFNVHLEYEGFTVFCDEVFVQECVTPGYGETTTRCVWRGVESPHLTLEKLGPLHWELRSGGGTMLMLKGAGDSPASIAEGMFRAVGDGGGTYSALWPTIDITEASTPEGYVCLCDATDCSDCTDEDETLTIEPPCEGMPPLAVPRIEADPCEYEITDHVPETPANRSLDGSVRYVSTPTPHYEATYVIRWQTGGTVYSTATIVAEKACEGGPVGTYTVTSTTIPPGPGDCAEAYDAIGASVAMTVDSVDEPAGWDEGVDGPYAATLWFTIGSPYTLPYLNPSDGYLVKGPPFAPGFFSDLEVVCGAGGGSFGFTIYVRSYGEVWSKTGVAYADLAGTHVLLNGSQSMTVTLAFDGGELVPCAPTTLEVS